MSEILNLIKLVSSISGKDLTIFDESFLERNIFFRMSAMSVTTIKEYTQHILSNENEVQNLIVTFNNSYTEFFRNPLTFAFLEQYLLPQITSNPKENESKNIRVWSAGCSTGEEAYSLAILLDNLQDRHFSKFKYQVIATDHSFEAIEYAKKGKYDFQSILNIKSGDLANLFTQNKDHFIIKTEIRDKVDFSTYDLLDPFSTSPPSGIYGDFDIVFCSNVLYYYNKDVQNLIRKKLISSLKTSGFLIVDETEINLLRSVKGIRQFNPLSSIFVKI